MRKIKIVGKSVVNEEFTPEVKKLYETPEALILEFEKEYPGVLEALKNA